MPSDPSAGLLKLQATMAGEPVVDHPRPERLISGNPRRETWLSSSRALPGGATLHCGVWRCEPGHWRIAFGPQQHELFTVLQGHCRLHNASGDVQTAGPGEALSIPPGFEGSFEVIATVTKTFAIVEGPPAPG